MKKILLILCLVLMLGVVAYGCTNTTDNNIDNDIDETSIITISNELPVNFVVDEDGKIVEVTPESEDAAIVVAGEDYVGLTIEEALEKFLTEAKNCGYDLKDQLEVKITSKLNSEKAQALKDKITNKCNSVLETLTGAKEQCNVTIKSLEDWYNELKENDFELTEEQKADVDEAWNKIKSYVSQAKYFSSDKLQELYDAYQEKEIDKLVQDTYEEILQELEDKGTLSEEKINEFKKFLEEQKEKYTTSENNNSKAKELLAEAKKYLDEQVASIDEKKQALDEKEAIWQQEIKDNTEKYGETIAKVMSAGAKLAVDAAKLALDGANKLYEAACTAYQEAKEKYASNHNGDELTLKNLVKDIKDATSKFLEEHTEIKQAINTTYEEIKAKVQTKLADLKTKFEEEYKTEIEEYYQQLIDKKNELINKNNSTENSEN